MRISLIFTSIICLQLSLFAAAQQEPNDSEGDIRYISDNLQTFMHSGPGRNYRILGSVASGTRITVLQENTDSGFIEIIDDSQRTGWVLGSDIQQQASVKSLLPKVSQTLETTETALSNVTRENDLLNQQLSDVNNRNANLVSDLAALTKRNEQIQRALDTQDQSAQMQWLIRGGIIALVGMIFGVIVAYLPKKRRRNDQWM